MGNVLSDGSSSRRDDAATVREFVDRLGDRFPFGNDEIVLIVEIHEAMRRTSDEKDDRTPTTTNTTTTTTSSFLRSLDAAGDRAERTRSLEEELLPEGFGRRLAREILGEDSSPPPPPTTTTTTARSVARLDAASARRYRDDPVRADALGRFLEGLSACCGRRGGRRALEVLFRCCVADDGAADAEALVDAAHRAALAAERLSGRGGAVGDGRGPRALAESLARAAEEESDGYGGYGGGFSSSTDYFSSASSTARGGSSKKKVSTPGRVDKDIFLRWAESTAPLLSSILPTLFHALLFPDRPFPPSRTPFRFPTIDHGDADADSDSTSSSTDAASRFALACASPLLGGTWHRLFDSERDGLSFHRLLRALLGYNGPTLLWIRPVPNNDDDDDDDDRAFGAFVSCAWKESPDFLDGGGGASFLFRAAPSVGIHRPRGGARNHAYCNPESRSRGYDGLPHGLGFGGDVEEGPRLFLTETLEGCRAGDDDLTYERGELLLRGRRTFDVERLEAFAVGGAVAIREGLERRRAHREAADAALRKARKVDRAQFLDDFKSGLIDSKAFQHRDQMRGNARAEVDDEHGGYKYET